MSDLVHIVKIEMAEAGVLSSMLITSPSSCHFRIMPDFQEIDIQELVGVKIEDTCENNQKVFTTTATFYTKDKTPMSSRQKCFRLTSVSGQQYIIGTAQRPYPIIKENNAFPEKPADSTLKQVTITWKAPHPMLQVQI